MPHEQMKLGSRNSAVVKQAFEQAGQGIRNRMQSFARCTAKAADAADVNPLKEVYAVM